jgi:hypothetical protein
MSEHGRELQAQAPFDSYQVGVAESDTCYANHYFTGTGQSELDLLEAEGRMG